MGGNSSTAEIQEIDYEIGTLPLPTNYKGLRVFLPEFDLNELRQKIEESSTQSSTESLEVTIQSSKYYHYYNLKFSEEERNTLLYLSSLLPHLKFMRVIYLGGPRCENDKILHLTQNFRGLKSIEICHNTEYALAQMQEKVNRRNMKYMRVRSLRSALILKEQEFIPGSAYQELTDVDFYLYSELQNKNLKYCHKVKEWGCLRLRYLNELDKEPPFFQSIRQINFSQLRSLCFSGAVGYSLLSISVVVVYGQLNIVSAQYT